MDVYVVIMYVIGWILAFVSLFPAGAGFVEEVLDTDEGMTRVKGLAVLGYLVWFGLMIVAAPWFIPIQFVGAILALAGWALWAVFRGDK